MQSTGKRTILGYSTAVLIFAAAVLVAAWSMAQTQGTAPTAKAAPRANRYFGAHKVLKVKRDRDGGRALPDDAVAAIQSTTALPPYTQQVAPFIGNLTAVVATPGNAFVMARESNCSLTAFNLPYSLSLTSPYTTATSTTASFEQTLHSAAGLTTPPDQFTGGCKDPLAGINSNQLIYAGQTTGGIRTGVFVAYTASLGFNALYTVVAMQNGAFTSVTQQPIPTAKDNYPSAAAAGDLNGDGNPDIISVNYGGSGGISTVTASFTVLLGNANGTFTVGQTYTLPGNKVDSLVIDDFNGDGKLDVVIPSESFNANLSSAGSTLSFLPGNGDGTFGTAVTLTSATMVDSLVSGDFNGDGNKDLVAGTGQVFLGNGKGTFAPQTAAAFPALQTNSSAAVQLAVGDFNKDGKLDLAGGTGNSIYMFNGNGDGTFTAGNVYAGIGNQGYVTATDLDGDGNLDLYSGDASAGVFGGDEFDPGEGYALMGNGDGTFTGAPQVTYASFNALQDLNGDGKLDFVGILASASPMAAPTFGTYYGQGNGTFRAAGAPLAASPFTYQGTPYTFQSIDSYAAADINGDGLADLVYLPSTYSITPPRLGFLTALGSAGGSFQAPVLTPAPSLLLGGGSDQVMALGNLYGLTNQSGKFEILYSYQTLDLGNSNNYYQGYAVQVSNGDGTFAAPVLTVSSSSASAPATTLPPDPVNVADLNGDKIPDLIVYVPPVAASGATAGAPAALQVLLGNSDGTFQAPQPLALGGIPGNLPLAIADINGDGKVDLVAIQGTANNKEQIAIALGKGDGTFATPTTMLIEVYAIGGPTDGVALGDFNGDGKLDLALSGLSAPFDFGIFPGNGDGTFQSLPTGNADGSVEPAEALQVGGGAPAMAVDINGDGKTDLLSGDTFLIQQSTTSTPPPPPVPQASSTALTASAATIVAGQSVSLDAVVTAASGSTVPTGTVTFLDGTTTLGTGMLNSSGQAVYSATSLAVGKHSLTAAYSGDTNFSASTSSAVSVTVTAPVPASFSLSLSPASATVTHGSTATSTISIAPAGGFNSSVSLTCSGLPSHSSCSFTPASVTPNGTAAVTSTLTISTDVASAAAVTTAFRKPLRVRDAVASFAMLGGGGLFGLALFRRRKGHALRSTWFACMLALSFGTVGAGVGCGGGNGSGGSSQNTPAGTYSVVVSGAAGSNTQTATYSLTVQ